MNKKILVILLFIGVAIVSYSLLGEDKSFKERVVVDKNAKIAIKFSKYIYDYSKKNNSRKFYKRFNGVPLEGREQVWNTLKGINSLPKSSSVTTPAIGKAKRYVYYDIKNKKYCFTVSLIKKKWQLKNIRKVEK